MSEEFGVGGRVGDVSGRVGDVSGRVGDVSGRVGDVSGKATFEEVKELLIQDRRALNFGHLDRRVAHLEFEIVALARWFELRLRNAEKDLSDDIGRHNTAISTLQSQRLDTRLDTLESQNLDTRLKALESQQTLDTRLKTLESQNLDARLKALEPPKP